jgi:tripartite-type tricarboxylate transporter receptor subunit TctC
VTSDTCRHAAGIDPATEAEECNVVVSSGSKWGTAAARGGVATVLLVAAVGCSGAQGGGEPDSSEQGGDVFRGEQIDFVVPFDPGGGYDVYTRTIAPYLEECLGARIVVRNEPGAGSLLATNKTAVSPPDGTRIQIMNMPGVLGSQIAGADGVEYDLHEFSWIGRIASPPDVVLANPDGDLTNFENLAGASDSVQFVATGPGSSDYVAAAVLGEAYGIPHEIATGFAGSQEATNAVVTGEADVHIMPFDTVLPVIEAGDVTPAALIAEEVPEYMPETPLIVDFPPESEEGKALVDQLMALTASGRAVTAPPGVPEDRLTALREGFDCAMKDQKLLDELAGQQRPVNFMDGEEYAALVDKILEPTPEFKAVLEKSF